ncbi:hypothetical protein E3N88_39424 [Mikania micrantha]|uniref:Apyrase n=1 Tax=Mikania micrantha TaxID=192012 RepID=A0A5N6LWX9_9ASTR|nr:hypothetical protein E3N88_39424 [Mikania micrantha]
MLKAVATTNSNRNLEFPILLRTFPDNLTEIDHHKDGCAYHCMQTEPGLDKFVGDAYGIEKSLEPLIRRAEKWVPNEKHQDTPIFVLATAGLRRLNKDIARGVLDDIENVVKLHEFKVRKDWIRVLSGEEEAYYGWIALNHHMGMFGNTSRLPTLGLLDLGGSSLQVATESKQLKGNEYGIFRSKIGSFEHQIMAASLPTFGLNEAFDRTVVMLSHSQAFIERDFGTFEIAHPCLSYEFTQNYTCHGCFEGNFTRKIRKSNNFLINLVGEPNWEKCKLLARAAAVNSSSSDWSKLSDDSYCTGLSSINGESMLNLLGKTQSAARYHALSGFFAVYNLLDLDSSANLSKIWEKGQKLCSKSLLGLTKMPINQKYADFLCFRVPYMISLLQNTLCVGDKEIIFGPVDVSWTLGAALVEGKDLWLSDTNTSKSSIFSYLRFKIMLFSPPILFVVLAILLYAVYRSQIKLPLLGRNATSLPSYIGSKRRAPLM